MTSRKLPQAFILDGKKKLRVKGAGFDDLIDMHELPEFIVSADEIEEAKLAHKENLLRVLNKTPVNYLNQW